MTSTLWASAAVWDATTYLEKSVDWCSCREFAGRKATGRLLADAGYSDIETGLEPALTAFLDAPTFREFVRSAVLRAHLDALPDDARNAFMSGDTSMAAPAEPRCSLYYGRLNLAAKCPPAS